MIWVAMSNHTTPFLLNNHNIALLRCLLFHKQNGEMAINKSHLLNRKKASYQLQIGIIFIHCKNIVFFLCLWKKSNELYARKDSLTSAHGYLLAIQKGFNHGFEGQ
jgi:hypothetical protein